MKVIKNKLSSHINNSSFFRIWVQDGSGEARGIDPVFDTIYYLKETGQLSGARKGFKLKLDGLGLGKKPIPWEYLKKWVLGDKSTMKSISEAMGYKPMDLRSFCFKQITSGKADELFMQVKNSKVKDDNEDEASDE